MAIICFPVSNYIKFGSCSFQTIKHIPEKTIIYTQTSVKSGQQASAVFLFFIVRVMNCRYDIHQD